jgi:hypothetical protein
MGLDRHHRRRGDQDDQAEQDAESHVVRR